MAELDEYEHSELPSPEKKTLLCCGSSSPISYAPSSDAVEVPISSSPGGCSSPLMASQASIISVECTYSISESTDSCATTQPSSPVRSEALEPSESHDFANALTERLLVVASERSADYDSDRQLSGSSGETTPRHSYRLVKRAHSHSITPGEPSLSAKYRRLDPYNRDAATHPATPIPVRRWCTSVPVIAPPVCYAPRLPLSAETESKIRLGKFLVREAKERIRDGLLGEPQQSYDHNADWGSAQPPVALSNKPQQWERLLGTGRDLRERIIDWLTGVLPKHASGRYSIDGESQHSANSSFSSTSSTTSFELSNLYDQLASCPETRFHAVWMFLRYFWLVASDDEDVEDCGHGSCSLSVVLNANTSEEDVDDFDLAIWDTALACLALSVKFHRDFLVPLYPVQSQEFLALAPHEISYEDLEATLIWFFSENLSNLALLKAAQRDVLKALSYSVGVSPQAILDELWSALPSLRQAISFEGGWNALQKEVWFRLYEVVYAPDVLRFSQSRLVAIALIDSLIPCLAARYEYQAAWHAKAIRRRVGPNRERDLRPDGKARFIKRATEDAEGIILDIQAVVGITDGQLAECRAWWDEAVSRFRVNAS